MTAAVARLRALAWEEVFASSYATPALLLALTALSVWLRTGVLGGGFWIDEGISVGIAHHHWTSIPHLLRQDGSPPAYYMLLGLWIRAFGDSERVTHTLSLLFSLGCIPLAWYAGRALFDRRTALVAAGIAALDPFLTYYAQETRMYSLEAFLSLLATIAYVKGVLRGERAWAVALAPTLALMCYAHNWALFFCVAVAAATLIVARDRWRTLTAVAVGAAVLYLPWLPMLLSQAKHTGAPWATAPSLLSLLTGAGDVIGGTAPLAVVGAAAGAVAWRRAGREEHALLLLVGLTVLVAWISSQISPAWTTRYFSVVLGPVLLVSAAVLVRARRVGVVALAILFVLWITYHLKDEKENARQIAHAVRPHLHPGELVVSTHPEQVPVLRYYLGPGLRWRTTLGMVPDSRVFDWRDAVTRLRASRMRAQEAATVAAVAPGSEFVVVTPVFRDYRAWKATWTHLVWRKSRAYTAALAADPRVRLVHRYTTNEIAIHRNYFKPVQAFVFRRLR